MTELNTAQTVACLSSTGLVAGVNPPKEGNDTVMKVDEAQKQILSNLFPVSSRPLITTASAGSPDCVADYSYFIRQLLDEVGIDSPLFAVDGMTTAFNAVQGAVAFNGAYNRFQHASSIGNKAGKIESSVDMIRGIFQSSAGAAYTAYRPLEITTSIKGIDTSSVHASSLIGRVTYITGMVGGSLFGAVYAIMTGYFFYVVKRMHDFRGKFFENRNITKLNDPENIKKLMQFLTEKRLATSAESTLQKMLGAHTHQSTDVKHAKVKKELKKAALESAHTWIKATIKEIKKLPQASSLSEKECGKIAERLLEELDASDQKQALIHSLGLDECKDAQLTDFIKTLSFAELMGLDVKRAKREKKKEAKLAEFIGGKVVATIKKTIETNLTERLSSKDPVIQLAAVKEAKDILKEISNAMEANLVVNWFLFVGSAIGTIATILGFIFSSGGIAVVIGASFVVCAFSLLVADVMSLNMAQKAEGQTGSLDKWLLGLSTGIGIASLAAVIALGSVFSMGALPIAIAATISVLWLGNNIYSYYKLYQKEKNFELNHPTLASLSKRVSLKKDEELVDQSLKALMKNLSQAEKKALKQEAAKLLNVTHPNIRLLSDEDRLMDNQHDFGREFFYNHTSSPDVLRAVEKAYEASKTEALRGLYDRLKNLSKTQDSAQAESEIKEFFTQRLSFEEKSAVAQNIYNKRAKKSSSRYFETITYSDLKKALDKVAESKKAAEENARLSLINRSTKMLTALSVA